MITIIIIWYICQDVLLVHGTSTLENYLEPPFGNIFFLVCSQYTVRPNSLDFNVGKKRKSECHSSFNAFWIPRQTGGHDRLYTRNLGSWRNAAGDSIQKYVFSMEFSFWKVISILLTIDLPLNIQWKKHLPHPFSGRAGVYIMHFEHPIPQTFENL